MRLLDVAGCDLAVAAVEPPLTVPHRGVSSGHRAARFGIPLAPHTM